jgi:hypothetical protein
VRAACRPPALHRLIATLVIAGNPVDRAMIAIVARVERSQEVLSLAAERPRCCCHSIQISKRWNQQDGWPARKPNDIMGSNPDQRFSRSPIALRALASPALGSLCSLSRADRGVQVVVNGAPRAQWPHRVGTIRDRVSCFVTVHPPEKAGQIANCVF